jgi:hypothetical protein
MPAPHGRPWTWLVRALIFSTVGWSPVVLADSFEARQWIDAGDCKRAGDAINEGLAHNEASAFALAGYLYASTGCVTTDLARAAHFFQRAVELGDADSKSVLGFMYGMGNGVPQDYRLAEHWYSFGVVRESPLTPEQELARGYAQTITQYARSKVVYPQYNDAQGRVVVLFKVSTGEVTFQPGEITSDHTMSHVFKSTPFTDAIAEGYAEAVKQVAKPAELEQSEVTYQTPWTFRFKH